MESCVTCRDFLRLAFFPERVSDYSSRVCSRDEQRRIKQSAQDCRLCQKIYHFLEASHESVFGLPDSDDSNQSLKLEVFPKKSSLHGEETLLSSVTFRNGVPRDLYAGNGIPSDMLHSLNFSVWADEASSGPDSSIGPTTTETPAHVSFVTWPPILQGTPAETNGLVRKLLRNCLDHHESCRLVQPEEELELPSRVLSIKDDAGVLSVKLVENDGLSGRYCALSHCWGPEDKRPLRTLRGNMTDHLASIPWSELPATFQDAITLTRDLGFEYIWIDSLCIVQDDEKDWFDESKKMASVYRRASLVVAAVSAENSTQGLSKPERPDSLTFRVPYHITQEASSHAGYYKIAASIRQETTSIRGPLRDRAWAFQEWYLGRRKVFFTSEGVNWQCGGIECNERGTDVDLGLYETMSWLDCLREYTDKLLTVPSDRLVALLGIVAEMQKSRSDSFVPEFGVWEDDLAEQLLWRPTAAMRDNLLGLPSWCWAATEGTKLWLVDERDNAMVKSAVNAVSLGKSGSVNASGSLTRSTIAPLPLRDCCFWHFEDITVGDWNAPIDERILPGYINEHYDIGRFPILNPNGTDRVLGLAVFDRGIHFSECFCFMLGSTGRIVRTDPCHPDFDKDSSGSEEDWSTDVEDSGGAPEESGVEDGGNDDSDIEHGSFHRKKDWQTVDPASSSGVEESGVGDDGDGDDDWSVDESEDGYPGYTHGDTDACVDIFKAGRSKEVHWALLLQPVDDTMKKFARVGVALLWPRALKMAKGEVTEFEIV
ncbi:hypothetical protein CTA2_2591 [Colletotrichum tanaceti]|uniref:Heterokaryon incompatibility domain-containing protein n=1 Tax=Colletotrichum tanaceti TaxID=1306861 RepID=A0A4U6XMY3_9PEZI|nr:hypothetical protein CTA2_2591 [Colletotrichum tanaceti]TKW57048.1 hypothetical protein CTA1_5420 [Colletotrichum tanaceti]